MATGSGRNAEIQQHPGADPRQYQEPSGSFFLELMDLMSYRFLVQSGAGLADHFYRTQTQNEIENLRESLEHMKSQVENKHAEIVELTKKLEDIRAAQIVAEAITRNEIGCQGKWRYYHRYPSLNITCVVALVSMEVLEPVIPLETPNSDAVAIDDNLVLLNTIAKINDLQQQLVKDKSIADEKIAELSQQNEKFQTDIKDLTQRKFEMLDTIANGYHRHLECEFYETQIALQEKARQEILSENIKLTEEAHNMVLEMEINGTL